MLELEVGGELRRLVITKDLQVSADLGAPKLALTAVPCSLESTSVECDLTLGKVTLKAGILSMGNPHAVVLVDDCGATPVEKIGPMVQALDVFPESVNVSFMEIETASAVKLRVFERGVGETLACGSGACAAVVQVCTPPPLTNTRLQRECLQKCFLLGTNLQKCSGHGNYIRW